MNDGEQLAEFKSALAGLLEPAEPEQATPADEAAQATALVQALHPGATPVMGAEGEKAFNDVLQASADDFWAGWPS